MDLEVNIHSYDLSRLLYTWVKSFCGFNVDNRYQNCQSARLKVINKLLISIILVYQIGQGPHSSVSFMYLLQSLSKLVLLCHSATSVHHLLMIKQWFSTCTWGLEVSRHLKLKDSCSFKFQELAKLAVGSELVVDIALKHIHIL